MVTEALATGRRGAIHSAQDRTEILISGFGGQGVIRLGQILGLTAVKQGLKVTMLKSHGTETRGGYVRAQLVISPSYVDSPVVERADFFVAFSAAAYRKFLGLVEGTILYDPEMVPHESLQPGQKRHWAVPATKLSKETFNNTIFANMIMLGALVRIAGLDMKGVQETMLEVLPRFHDQNREALEIGYGIQPPA